MSTQHDDTVRCIDCKQKAIWTLGGQCFYCRTGEKR